MKAVKHIGQKTIKRAPREQLRLLGALSVRKNAERRREGAFAKSETPILTTEHDVRLRAEFCNHVREVARTERKAYDKQIALVQTEERHASLLSEAATSLALVLFAVGAALMLFLPQMITLTRISGLLGILSGGATALLRWQVASLRARRQEIEDRQAESRNTTLAIQAALTHADQRRRSSELTRVTNLITASRFTKSRQISKAKGYSAQSSKKRHRGTR